MFFESVLWLAVHAAYVKVVRLKRRNYAVIQVLWIRNCGAYSEPMTSHAPGGLAGSWRTLPHMREADGRHDRHIESVKSQQKSDTVN